MAMTTPANGQQAGQPFADSVYIALRDLKISEQMVDPETGELLFDENGNPVTQAVTIKAGSRVPDAANWGATLETLLRTGFLERQKDADDLAARLAALEARVDRLEGNRVKKTVRKSTVSSSSSASSATPKRTVKKKTVPKLVPRRVG